MPKTYSKELQDKAYFLRADNGLLHKDIATQLDVPLVTVKRWLKGVKPNTSPTRFKPKTPDIEVVKEIKENIGIIKKSKNIGGTEGLKELKNIGDTEKLEDNSFHDMNVTYNSNGGISLASGDKTNAPETAKTYVPETAKDQKPEPLIEQKREIIKPSMLDAIKIKTKDMDLLGILLPAACLGAGLLLNGKKRMKGEHREQGEDW